MNGKNFLMTEIGRVSLLTLDEEKQLLKKASKGDKRAMESLVKSNLRYVSLVANKYRGMGLDLEDLVSEGCIGLITAVKKFDPSKDVKLLTYATYWIHQQIRKALYESGCAFKLPANKLNELKKYRQKVCSADIELNEDDGDTLLDLISDEFVENPEECFFRTMEEDLLHNSIKNLKEKERKVIDLRYGFNGEKPMSLQKISELMKLSKEGVRQIENRALSHLREDMELNMAA